MIHEARRSYKGIAMEMEDCNALVADCIVISCCCECFILQIVVFLLLDLPCKVARKTREYAIRKLRRHTRKEAAERRSAGFLEGQYCSASEDEVFGSVRLIQLEFEIHGSSFSEELCLEEVDKVLEELSFKGEFAFGSFWGRDFAGRCTSSSGFSVNQRELFATHGCVH